MRDVGSASFAQSRPDQSGRCKPVHISQFTGPAAPTPASTRTLESELKEGCLSDECQVVNSERGRPIHHIRIEAKQNRAVSNRAVGADMPFLGLAPSVARSRLWLTATTNLTSISNGLDYSGLESRHNTYSIPLPLVLPTHPLPLKLSISHPLPFSFSAHLIISDFSLSDVAQETKKLSS